MDSNGLAFWMLSQLNDWLPPWRAQTSYLSGQGLVDPSGFIQVVQSIQPAGSSGSTAPVWKTAPFQVTSEALVTWINAGPGQWQADTQFAAGQCILDPDGYLQAAASITGMGRTGLTAPAWSTSTVQPTLDGQVVWARIDPQPWGPNQVYSIGQFVLDSNDNVQRVISTSVGASAGKAPAWNSTIGQTTIDGQVTWINAGPGKWQPNAIYPAGQYILDANGNLQTVISVTGTGMTGALQPTWPTAAGQTQADGNLTWLCCGPQQSGLFYCSSNNTLQLRSVRAGTPFLENFNQAASLVNTTPMTLDQFGNYARWDPTSGLVMAGGSGPSDAPQPNEVVIYAPGNTALTDLAMGYDGVLYLAIGGSLVMIDRRNRWPNFTLTVPDFNFWRLAALPEAGVLALDRSGSQLGKVAGQPLQTGPVDTPDPGILRPCQANQNPPRIVARFALPAAETYIAIAPMDPAQQPSQYVVLSWGANNATNQIANIRILSDAAPGITLASGPFLLGGVRFPYTIAWLGGQKFAVFATNAGLSGATQPAWPATSGQTVVDGSITWTLMGPPTPTQIASGLSKWQAGTNYLAGQLILDSRGNVESVTSITNEALIYNLADAGETLIPAGDTYVLPANNVGPMVHGFTLPPNYANVPGQWPPMLPLVPLSLNNLAPGGATCAAGPAIIDSGTAQCVWHRMFLEAIVPPRCGAVVWLTASDNQSDLYNSATSWYPHILGDANTSAIPPVLLAGTPTAVWQTISTEVAFAPTLLKGPPVQDTQGLFMVLVQRANRVVRNLTGRFLGVRIQLNGDGRNSPQIAGLRVYGPRFSYVQKYLPEIYHEGKFPPASDAAGGSTRRDFLERFVDLFESQFTRIEDRIANAYLLMRPESTPGDSLEWLGSWVGVPPSPNYPHHRRRARLEATPSLYQWRGTAKGVTEALDVATDGACTRGAIIVIEDFRLRHIFATILGANLAVENNPLLPGYQPASNSFVGDTLFLGDPRMQAELQALYETDLDIRGSAAAVQTFYDQLAYRMTVFVHNQVEDINLKMVQRIVEAEKPAHVQAFVKVAAQPFMIGLASLLGINTYLGPDPPRNQVTVDVSDVGRYDVVTEAPSLDPRMTNGWNTAEYAKPIARIWASAVVKEGGTIQLDGGASTSPAGTTITQYTWTLLQPPS
jgi:phage tail-like protein